MRARLPLLSSSRVIRSSLMAINRSSFIHLVTYTIDFSASNNEIYSASVVNIVISRCL